MWVAPILFLIVLAVLLGLGLLIGWGLHALIPSLELGFGTVAGVIAGAAAAHFLLRLLAMMKEFEEAKELEEFVEPRDLPILRPTGLRSRRRAKKASP
jgi:hypothetical protein